MAQTLLRCIAGVIVAGAVHAVAAAEVGSYFTAWSVEDGFSLKAFDDAGVAAKFTFLNYAFENVYRMPDGTYQCASGQDRDDGDDGRGMRATLDYAARWSADRSLAAEDDTAQQRLAGNFNQLRLLRERHPQLKVLVSLGGGTWSRWFSVAARSARSRRVLVHSCLQLFIVGDLPMMNGYGGKGAAAGVFDGIDVDWEHPGVKGAAYNTVSPGDQHNFTLLLAEFRRQLDQLSRRDHRRHYLTVAVNSGADHRAHTEPGLYASYLDWINLMTYDFHGAWNATGPTDFQSNLYTDPDSPDPSHPSVDLSVRQFVADGVPARKIVVGVPFYARGWRGVADVNHGLYQPAQQPAQGFEAGAERYASIAASDADRFYHPITHQLWTFRDGIFWTYDDPQVIADKAAYVRQAGLGGLMSWALDQDGSSFPLSRAMASVAVPAP